MTSGSLQQLRLVESADVYKSGKLTGTLHRLPDRTEFRYLPGYSGAPVAWSLPIRDEPHVAPAAAVPAFFAGLLPEGRRLTALRRNLGTSADDEFSMLLAAGSDTIGDVRVVPAGEPPDTRAGSKPVTVDDFSTVAFSDLFAQAIGPQPDLTALRASRTRCPGR
jgi:serine/threonine-protein kinase HipA